MKEHSTILSQSMFVPASATHYTEVERLQPEHKTKIIADALLRIPGQNFIQRKCAHCEEEEKIQRKPDLSFIQKKEASYSNAASVTVTGLIQSSSGNGNPLPVTTKSFMERRFDANFSNVHIHSDDAASQLSNQLHAQAFTLGSEIYFNKGKFAPESYDGKHLLAHELTHTLQQAGTAKNIIQRQVEITCSIDMIKIAKLFKGDKSAAAEVLNCCQKGLGPLPAGCSKDVVDAAKELLSKKEEDGSKSKECPEHRINRITGTCCPEQKHWNPQTGSCVNFEDIPIPGLPGTPPAISTPDLPDVPPADNPSEKGDWNIPDDDTAIV